MLLQGWEGSTLCKDVVHLLGRACMPTLSEAGGSDASGLGASISGLETPVMMCMGERAHLCPVIVHPAAAAPARHSLLRLPQAPRDVCQPAEAGCAEGDRAAGVGRWGGGAQGQRLAVQKATELQVWGQEGGGEGHRGRGWLCRRRQSCGCGERGGGGLAREAVRILEGGNIG